MAYYCNQTTTKYVLFFHFIQYQYSISSYSSQLISVQSIQSSYSIQSKYSNESNQSISFHPINIQLFLFIQPVSSYSNCQWISWYFIPSNQCIVIPYPSTWSPVIPVNPISTQLFHPINFWLFYSIHLKSSHPIFSNFQLFQSIFTSYSTLSISMSNSNNSRIQSVICLKFIISFRNIWYQPIKFFFWNTMISNITSCIFVSNSISLTGVWIVHFRKTIFSWRGLGYWSSLPVTSSPTATVWVTAMYMCSHCNSMKIWPVTYY